MLATPAVHAAVTEAEVDAFHGVIATAARLAPEIGACGASIGGGLAVFTGSRSPLSQAYGVGASSPVGESDVAALTEFFHSRGAAARVFVTPGADAKLGALLSRAGYAPVEYENVLAARVDALTVETPQATIRVADVAEWCRASLQGFMGTADVAPDEAFVATLIALGRRTTITAAYVDGEIAATGAMDCIGEWSGLFAASTLQAYRGRGLHGALILDRIERAREQGARFLRASASPGSVSERNFRRCGFSTLFTRVLWELALPSTQTNA